MSHDDKYKQSFETYEEAASACKRNQQPYRRLSDGRWCLTHKKKGRLRYNRAEHRQEVSKYLARYM